MSSNFERIVTAESEQAQNDAADASGRADRAEQRASVAVACAARDDRSAMGLIARVQNLERPLEGRPDRRGASPSHAVVDDFAGSTSGIVAGW